MPVTVYAVATALARNREAVAAMNEADWEIATHGLKWIDYRDTPPEVEARHIAEAIRIHTEVTGARPLGFYQGRSSINTIRLGMEEGGFLYCADTYADDLPYWIEGPRGPQLMTPYTLDANDMRFATPQGFNSGDQFYAYLKDCFDTLYAEGDVGAEDDVDRPALPAGRPARPRRRARALPRLCAQPRPGLDSDPARHRPPLDRQAPAAGRLEAVRTDPHAVRRALRRRLRAFALDRGGGLRRWGSRAARTRPRGWRRRLPPRRRGDDGTEARADRSPPDLAGKLALAKRLTADSTREQASAGLDRLSAEELRLHRAQRRLSRKVRFSLHHGGQGQEHGEILAAFRRRLANEPTRKSKTALAEIDRIAALRLEEILP